MAELMNIALVQFGLFWEAPEQNRDHLDIVLEGITSTTDLIVLPEMFTTGFTMHPENIRKEEGQKTLKWMQKWAGIKNSALTGSIVFEKDGSFTNRLFFVHPNGKTEQYDKKHTFTLAGESDAYKAGNKKLIVDYMGFKICPLICYDLRFPVWSRNLENYDVLLYVANWPKPRINAWDILLKARAIENMTYCIGVNRIGTDKVGHEYSGHSAVYDSLGEPLVFSENEEVIYATLSKEHISATRQKLKFLNDMDNFTFA
ncbi:MAG: amidohydrolase [Flavobacteriaceae bacterium]